jgi:hypothetical protein
VTTRAHVIVLLVALVTAVFILRLVRLHQLRSKYALLWLSIGAAMVPLAAFPRLLNTISDWFGVFYAPTTLLFFATGFLFVVVVHFSWELSRLETRSRALAEELALLQASLADPDDTVRR